MSQGSALDRSESTAVVDFVMPSLGADMDEGTVTRWLMAVGDRVTRGQVVAIVETDKADIDVEVWHDGVVTEILVESGRTVPVGTALARLDVAEVRADADADLIPEVRADADAATVAEPRPTERPLPEAPTGQGPRDGDQPAEEDGGAGRSTTSSGPVSTDGLIRVVAGGDRIPASPLARRLAAERGVDLGAMVGSGPGGAVVARDLEADVVAAAALAVPEPADRMRRAIAGLMSRSSREIPHYHLAETVDLEVMSAQLEQLNDGRSLRDRILPAAALLGATSRALAANPELNGFWADDRFQPGEGVHLGVAIALRGGGLVAPAIRNADRLDLDETMSALRDLVERARAGRLRGSEMTSATVTVTNLGDHGAELVHGVIHPPQVALVGFGRIVRRPAVVDDQVVPRRQVTVSLAADHRASDGQRGSRFLNDLRRLLSEPQELP